MKRGVFVGVFLALMCAFSVVGFAQSNKFAEYDKYMGLLRKDLRAGKKELIALNMPLTESEATKFWPVYEQYSNEVAKVYDARILLVKEYAANISSLSDSAAASLVKRTLDNDAALTKLRQQYAPIIEKVLPGKKAALFFQIDKRVGMLIEMQLASEIPLVVP